MDIYNAIFEKIQAKVDAGEYTLEEASQLNDLAYHRYVEESMELDDNLDNIENGLVEESRAIDRYYAKKAKEGVEKYGDKLRKHLASEEKEKENVRRMGMRKWQREEAKKKFDDKTDALERKFHDSTVINAMSDKIRKGSMDKAEQAELRKKKDAFYKDLTGKENTHSDAKAPVAITKDDIKARREKAKKRGFGPNEKFLSANTPTEKEQKEIDKYNAKLKRSVPLGDRIAANAAKKKNEEMKKNMEAKRRVDDRMSSIIKNAKDDANRYVNGEPAKSVAAAKSSKKTDAKAKSAPKKILTARDAVNKTKIEGKGLGRVLNTAKAALHNIGEYGKMRKMYGATDKASVHSAVNKAKRDHAARQYGMA